MSISLVSSVWGAVVLVVSTGYQYFFIPRWATRKAKKIEESGENSETQFQKNLALAQEKSRKLTRVVAITLAALIISYGLSIYDAATDTKEKRLEAIESQVASPKIPVGERR